MWAAISAIATVVGIIPVVWKAFDLFGADVVVDRISNGEVVLANRSEHAEAENVQLKIAAPGDTDFQIGDDPDTLDHDSVKWQGNNGNIPPGGEMRLDLEECNPKFTWAPAKIEIKTIWNDDLSWLPDTIYSPSNRRRFNSRKMH